MKPPESVVSRVRQLMKTGKWKGNAAVEKVPADEFIALLYEHGSAYKLAKVLGVSHTMVSLRRRNIEAALDIELPKGRPETWREQAHRKRITISLDDGLILSGSDLHAWPEIYGVAMAAFIDFNRRMKPQYVILNGDGLDGAQISRHSRLGWDKRPTPAEEIEALADYLDQLRAANPNAIYIRTRGNHDTRLETYLASNAPLVEGMKGSTLADHIPGWQECISVWVNDGECIFKHRGRHNGIHATFNEVRRLAANFVHGHLHRQKLVTHGTARGQVWGVDLGMLAPQFHPGFDYTEDSVEDSISGFGLFRFAGRKLLMPDLATVVDEDGGKLKFGGRILSYEL